MDRWSYSAGFFLCKMAGCFGEGHFNGIRMEEVSLDVFERGGGGKSSQQEQGACSEGLETMGRRDTSRWWEGNGSERYLGFRVWRKQ